MPIDTTEPESPGWWLEKCAKKLDRRIPRLQMLADMMEGSAPIPKDSAPETRDAYLRFRRQSRTNYAELIVETLRRRMVLTGFRTAVDNSREGDKLAREMWDTNGMGVELPDVLTNMLGLGDGYTMLGRLGDDELDEGADPIDAVAITGEDPRQVVTIHDPVRQRVVRAGAKLYHDDDYDLDVAYLHLPGRRWVAVRERKVRSVSAVRFSPASWDWSDDHGGEDGEETGLSRVPIVRWRNRRGVSEFEHHLDLLARLDSNVFRRDVIAAVQAFRQRAAFNTPDEDDDGNVIDWDELLAADPGALWRLPDGAQLWESQATDLRPLLDADKADVTKLSAVTSTPMYVFFPDAASGSAAGAALLGAEHAAKADDRVARASESARDTASIGFEILGDRERAKRKLIQPLWAPTERYSLAERFDANTKAEGVPWRTRMTRVLGFTETEVEQMELERAEEELNGAGFLAELDMLRESGDESVDA